MIELEEVQRFLPRAPAWDVPSAASASVSACLGLRFPRRLQLNLFVEFPNANVLWCSSFFPLQVCIKLHCKHKNIEFSIQALIFLLICSSFFGLDFVHSYGLAKLGSLGFSSSRTAWRWSTPAFPSCVSEGTGSSWPQPAGTTACGYSGGGSCSRWRCWSTTLIWCKAWPSLTTRTPSRGCWLLGPETSGSACGPSSMRNQRPAELQVLTKVMNKPTQRSQTFTKLLHSVCCRIWGSSAQWWWDQGRRANTPANLK